LAPDHEGLSPIGVSQRGPAARRLVAAFALAVSIPLFLVGILFSLGGSLVSGFGFALVASFYAIVPAALVGIPAYLVLRRVAKPNIWLSIAVGALTASLPWILASAFSPVLVMVAVLGAPLGAIGGLIFWLIALRPLTRAIESAGSRPTMR
jgi:uncharacterized membrane protein